MKTLTPQASSFQKTSSKSPDYSYSVKTNFKSNAVHFLQYSYLVFVFLLVLISIVELKHIYKIDLFPGIDTPIDNVYFEGKESLNSQIL